MIRNNNQKIIFDTDVVVTNDANIGKDLYSVLSSQEKRISTIESNTKWLYKYGGMGSGGTGGSTTSWTSVVKMDDYIVKDGDELNLGKTGTYKFSIQIYNGGESKYKITWKYSNASGEQEISDTASEANGFLVERSLLLNTNAVLNIEILNQDTFDIKTYKITYKTLLYQFNTFFVYADNHKKFTPYEKGDIFMGEVKSRGLQMALDYQMNTDLDYSKYTYVDWNGNTHTVTKDDTTGTPIKGRTTETIYLNLVSGEISSFLNNNDNASLYNFTTDISVKLDGQPNYNTANFSYYNNLIPDNLYLKVLTDSGSIHKNKPSSYTKEFSIGTAVFNITPFRGEYDETRNYSLTVKKGSDSSSAAKIDVGITQLKDRKEQQINVPISESGEQYVEFTIKYDEETYTIGYYFKVKPISEDFTWYGELSSNRTMLYKQNLSALNVKIGTTPIKNTDSFNMTFNSKDIEFNITDESPRTKLSIGNEDQLLCFGVQYSSINDTTNPIISFNTSDGKGSFYIYQDKVVETTDSTIKGISKDIYIDMVDEMDAKDVSKFHLITIYKKYEKTYELNNYKSVSIFIDGILEGVFNSFDAKTYDFTKIKLYSGNYYVKLFEYSTFEHSSSGGTSLRDNDILGYYYSFLTKMMGVTIDSDEKSLYSFFNQLTYLSDNFISCNQSQIENIALSSNVPVLLMEFTDQNAGIGKFEGYNQDNFKLWMQESYQEYDKIATVAIKLKWSKGKSNLTYINDISGTTQADFQTTLQGSSTRSYRCKNFELMAPASDGTNTYLFSPNFDSTNSSTFLPDSSFTLKADVVDSSHSNNNAMGRFINQNTTKFEGAKQSEHKYNSYIKNCLEGFPILLFLHTKYKSAEDSPDYDKENYYYLGIYNFNLGRGSQFNLGYRDLKLLNDKTGSGDFKVYSIESTKNTLLKNIRAGEIQGGDHYFDFSQYDDSILFQIPDTDDNTYMFGDFVDGDSTSTETVKVTLKDFVKKISLGGGYIFDELKKKFSNLSDDHYGYDYGYNAVDSSGISKEQVPNYHMTAKRSYDGTDMQYKFSTNPLSGSSTDLEKAVMETEEGEKDIPPAVNYKSLVEYYTTCMAFGLIDSVQKNLNLKSWNAGKTFYVAFYDMDTCLGIANDGRKVDYYAFSDYWKTSYTSDEIPKLNAAVIYRDFAPPTSKDTGKTSSGESLYDIPSSYLFAIAKYTTVFNKAESLKINPNNLWGQWRNGTSGCLKNADYFINTYYKDHLSKVSKSAFNSNYRYKYLVLNATSNGYDTTNFSKFWGRRLGYTKNWMNNRLHILDAYFNMNQVTDKMSSSDKYAPSPDSDYIDPSNKDIYVLREIFSNTPTGMQYSNIKQDVTINALPSSPIIIKTNNKTNRYLTLPYYGKQKFLMESNGSQHILFGGSPLWTYIDNINVFINSNSELYLSSKYITNIYGNSGTCKKWSLNVPSIQEVTLTSEYYSSDESNLTFGENNPNLQKVDISKSKIKLDINNSTLHTIIAKNMGSGSSINVLNTTSLSSVDLFGDMDSLTIPAWKTNITLPTNYKSGETTYLNCKNITLTSDTSKYPHSKLTIRNNSTLTALTLQGFETIDIEECPNLQQIIINGTDILKNIRVVFSNGHTGNFQIGLTNNIIDLSSQKNLSSIKFQYCGSQEIKIGNSVNVVLESQALFGCSKLEKLTTINSSKFLIKGSQVFQNCNNLKLVNGTVKPNMELHDGVTSLYATFLGSGKMTIDDVSWFFDTCCNSKRDKVNSIQQIFQNQKNINYTKTDWVDDYNNSKCKIDLNFPNCTNASRAFYNTGVSCINRYMFKNLGSEISTLNISQIFPGDGYTLYVTEDFLHEIIDKLPNLHIAGSWETCPLYFKKITGNTLADLNPVQAFNVFHKLSSDEKTIEKAPTQLSSLIGFNVVDNLSVDLDKMFTKSWKKAVEDGIEIEAFAKSKKMNIKGRSLEGLFKNIKLKSIKTSFSNVNYDDSLDLYEFINWNNISCATNLFWADSIAESETSLKLKKHVSLNNFHKIWDNIISARNLGSIAFLFQNTIVSANSYDDDDPFFLNSDSFRNDTSNNPNTSITAIPYLFDELSVVKAANQNCYLSLNHSFLKYMPNVSNFRRTFHGWYLYHTLPYDFFNKRKENYATVYLDKEGEEERVEGKHYYSSYQQDISALNNTFEDVRCQNDFNGFDPSASYNENCVSSDEYLVYNDETPCLCGYYYQSQTTSIKNYLGHLTEVTDCNISTDYSNIIKIKDKSGTDIELKNYSLPSNITNKLFIAPDILYGVKNSNCEIDNMFANNRGDENTFVGALPPNMFKNVKTISFKNVFHNLNILPQYFGEYTKDGLTHKCYTFVPSKFTDCTSLDSSFGFRIFLPNIKSITEQIHYCILLKDSIPNTVNSMVGSLPSKGYWKLFDEKSPGNGTYAYSKFDHGLKYSIMDTMKYDSSSKFNGTDSGIDLDHFTKLKVDKLIQPYLIRVLAGHVFQENWDGTNLKSHIQDTKNSVIDIGGWGHFSKALNNKFPINNDCFIEKYTGGESSRPSIHQDSVNNFKFIDQGKYNGINFIDY